MQLNVPSIFNNEYLELTRLGMLTIMISTGFFFGFCKITVLVIIDSWNNTSIYILWVYILQASVLPYLSYDYSKLAEFGDVEQLNL